MVPDDTLLLIACRVSKHKTGYHCESCGKDLEISEYGLTARGTSKHAHLLCNLCAVKYAELSKAMNKLDGVALAPAADDYMKTEESKNNPLAEWVRKNTKS